MNLSFSTNRWGDISLESFIDIAREYKFQGIEIHDISEVTTEQASEINHKLLENKVKISCIDMVSDIAGDNVDASVKEFMQCVELCITLHTPYIRIKASSPNEENVVKFIEKALPIAEKNNIVILVETVGIYSDTSKLIGLLNSLHAIILRHFGICTIPTANIKNHLKLRLKTLVRT